MAHFAKLENQKVTTVVVVDNSHEANGHEYLNGLGLVGTWVQTSYNANFGKKFAGHGDTFDGENFKPAEPDTHLGFDEDSWSWIMPEPEETPE
jgi:hypothetical protein